MSGEGSGAGAKRKIEEPSDTGSGGSEPPPSRLCVGEPVKKKRRVMFQDVTVYYFNRRQGFICVPSQGGNTLGMEDEHFAAEVVSIDDHIAERRGIDPVINHHGQVELLEEEDTDLNLLLPVDSKERRVVLREAGVQEIVIEEKEECRQLRITRQLCGCTCTISCDVESCECAAGGIMCQVDRPGFPCACAIDTCGNPSGRLEFNPVKVRTHFVKTIMRTRLEEARYQAAHSSYLPGQLGYLAHLYNSTETAQATSSCWGEAASSVWDTSAGVGASATPSVGWWTSQGTVEVEAEEGTASSSDESEEAVVDVVEDTSENVVKSILDKVMLKVTGEDEPRSQEPLSSSCLLSSKAFQPACALFPGTSSYSGAGIVPASCMAISPTHQFTTPHSPFFQTAAAAHSSAFFSSVPSTESSVALLAASASSAASYSPALASTNSGCIGLQPDSSTSEVHFDDVQNMPADVQVTEDVHGENGYSYFQISSSVRHLQQSFYQHSPYHQYNDNSSYHNLMKTDLREKMKSGDVNYIQTGLTETELEIPCRSEPSIENIDSLFQKEELSKEEILNSSELNEASESSISTERQESKDSSETSTASINYSMNQLSETKQSEFGQKVSYNKSTVYNQSENIVQTKESISYIVKDNTVGCQVNKNIEETVQTDSGLESTSSIDSSDNSQDYSDFHTTEQVDTVTRKGITTTTTTKAEDISENDVNSDDSGSQCTSDESTIEDSQFNDSEQVINVCHLKDAQSDYQPKKLNLCQTDTLSLSCETDTLSSLCETDNLSSACQPSVTNQAMEDILKQNLVESTKA